MNDYKELIEELRAHCLCITNGDNCDNCEGLISEKAYCRLQIELHKKAADAIEQLVKEYNELDKAHDEMFLELCKVKKERDALKEKLKIVWGWRGATDDN